MKPDELEAWATQTATALDIALPEGGAAQIAEQLAILFEHAASFSEFDLPPEIEPLTEFTP